MGVMREDGRVKNGPGPAWRIRAESESRDAKGDGETVVTNQDWLHILETNLVSNYIENIESQLYHCQTKEIHIGKGYSYGEHCNTGLQLEQWVWIYKYVEKSTNVEVYENVYLHIFSSSVQNWWVPSTGFAS